MTANQQSARERILDTAGQLFYQRGFHAVGIDTIVAASGVAKMTLYRHFASKDDLIVAYLERSNEQFWRWIDGVVADVRDPKAQLEAMFEAFGQLANSPRCLGCTFQGTAGEFPAREHPVHAVALAHKQAVRERLRTLAEAAQLREPDQLAAQLLLLMDGAWAAARMFGPGNAAAHVAAATQTLINAHTP